MWWGSWHHSACLGHQFASSALIADLTTALRSASFSNWEHNPTSSSAAATAVGDPRTATPARASTTAVAL
jgi:hypothetical protein